MRRVKETHSIRGITLVEVLVAALILAVGLMTLMDAWIFAFGVTRRSDEVEVGYNLARSAVERMRSQGYFFVDPTPLPQWYDANQQPVSDSSGAYYRVRATVQTGGDIGGSASYLNLKQLDVSVTRVSDRGDICRIASYLSPGGV